MSEPTAPTVPRVAAHSHYVSLQNDTIYPAMTYPVGYEDDHPNEYRVATAAEIKRLKAGKDSVSISPLPTEPVDAAPNVAAPAMIQLAEEDEAPPPPAATPPPPPAVTAVPPPPPALGGTKTE